MAIIALLLIILLAVIVWASRQLYLLWCIIDQDFEDFDDLHKTS